MGEVFFFPYPDNVMTQSRIKYNILSRFSP